MYVLRLSLVMILLSFLFACSDEPIKAQFLGTPAASSKFSQLKSGMGIYEVKKLLGQPDDQWEHVDASGYNRQMEFYYKNEGQLTFDFSSSRANHLSVIKVDQNATGSKP